MGIVISVLDYNDAEWAAIEAANTVVSAAPEPDIRAPEDTVRHP